MTSNAALLQHLCATPKHTQDEMQFWLIIYLSIGHVLQGSHIENSNFNFFHTSVHHPSGGVKDIYAKQTIKAFTLAKSIGLCQQTLID